MCVTISVLKKCTYLSSSNWGNIGKQTLGKCLSFLLAYTSEQVGF
jgi:uncharacterized protein YydD (DUF2326 family)